MTALSIWRSEEEEVRNTKQASLTVGGKPTATRCGWWHYAFYMHRY